MNLRRRRAGDLASLGHLQAELDHERAHSKHQAVRIAEQAETIRHLTESVDHWKGEARRRAADMVNAKATKREAS